MKKVFQNFNMYNVIILGEKYYK